MGCCCCIIGCCCCIIGGCCTGCCIMGCCCCIIGCCCCIMGCCCCIPMGCCCICICCCGCIPIVFNPVIMGCAITVGAGAVVVVVAPTAPVNFDIPPNRPPISPPVLDWGWDTGT